MALFFKFKTFHMKKLFLALSFITAVVINASAGTPDPAVSEKAKATFKKEFPGAELVSWSSSGEFSKAVFIYAGSRTEAYFNEEGELQGSARNIFYSQLPMAVTKTLEKRFLNPEPLEISEITLTNSTRYAIRLDAGNKRYMAHIDAGGNIIDIDRVRK